MPSCRGVAARPMCGRRTLRAVACLGLAATHASAFVCPPCPLGAKGRAVEGTRVHRSGAVHPSRSAAAAAAVAVLTGRARSNLPSLRSSRYEDYDDDDYENDYYDDDGGGYEYDVGPARRSQRARPSLWPMQISSALLAGAFVLGIGTGVTVDSAINTNPRDLASRDAIDRNAPNPTICQTYGASAMVVDQRVFVTFNPFSVHVSQADTKPGCVLRPSNVVEVLERKWHLLTDEEVQTCKSGMNTWAYVGDLKDKPQLSCVYQSDDAQNEFLSNPKIGVGEDVYDDDRAASVAARQGSKDAQQVVLDRNGK